MDAILVRFDRVYGNVLCYPANEQAKVLARLSGNKTLSPRTLAGARALGLQVMEMQDTGQLADFLAGALV